MRFVQSASGVIAALVVVGTASAAPTVSTLVGGDGTFNALTINGSLERFVTEHRLGAPGGWTMGIWERGGVGTPKAQATSPWTNGVGQSFSIVYDGVSSVSLTIGGTTISWNAIAGSFTDIFIRVRSVAFASIVLSDLDLVGSGAVIPNLSLSGPGVDYLRISNNGTAFGAFTLNGRQAMAWAGPAPTGSNLAAQFKFSNVIPTPGSLALLGAGALLVARRRR